jgi:hypothetical protein
MTRTKNDMLAIEPTGDDGSDEELGAVRVRPCISHGQEARFGVLQFEILVYAINAISC